MQRFIEKRHSLVFSVLSLLCFELITIFYFNFGVQIFLTFSVLFFFIFVYEALLSFRLAEDLKSKLPLPYILDDIKHIHISHHILLPMFLYISICAFIFFNGLTLQSEIVIILGGVTFYSIFEGKRSSFKKEFIFDETLHYIYDSIKIIIFFLGIDIILQSQIYFNFNQIFTFIASQVLAFILFLLIIVRKQQFNSVGILYIFTSSIITATTAIFLITHFPVITIALITSVIFYLLVGIIHHKINATLTPAIMMEYALIALIILLALKGISN